MSRSLSDIMSCDGIEELHVHETLEFASKGTKVGFLKGEMIDNESREGKFFFNTLLKMFCLNNITQNVI